MDFQNRVGSKTGSGGVASWSESNRDRRERLRQLALETIDLNKDPYFMKNHLGSYECKLCLTLHNNEGSYLAHTQGKKHQQNLARRAAKEAKEAPAQPAPEKARVNIKKFVKIGRPGYKVTKQRDSDSGQHSLLFQIDYPEIGESVAPRHRFMSAYEQRIEPPDKTWQYLLIAAEPYETISFKVPSREIDKSENRFWTHWNKDTKQFFLQFHFKLTPSQIQQNAAQKLQQQQQQEHKMRKQHRPPGPPMMPPPPPGIAPTPPPNFPPPGPPPPGHRGPRRDGDMFPPHGGLQPPRGPPRPPGMDMQEGPPMGEPLLHPPPGMPPSGPPGTEGSFRLPPPIPPPNLGHPPPRPAGDDNEDMD
ncbi:splicing factor 3A subunit 2-like [Rhopilema esculentum]|uniref:splicing factor 3A subunit 2-like n=1 Tax=Rhopilema esculentum TaxID=499914 RepID=UPI0031D51829|eukprot:gene12811-3550_t